MDRPRQPWLPVPGWEDLYEVSDQGLIWSIKPRRGTRGGLMKTPVGNRGYKQVNLCRDGAVTHTFVHLLVATAFHGPCPPGMECRHLDDDRLNCTASNLAWGTQGENNLDRVRNGIFRNRNTGKTVCDYGHEFTPENTGRDKRGNRFCIHCKKRRNSELAERRRLARHAEYKARLATR